MSIWQPQYVRAGLTNSQSVDIGEYATSLSKKNLGLFCTSDKCCQTAYFNKKGYQTYKRVSMVFKTNSSAADTQCLECRCEMTWRELDRSQRVNIAEKRNKYSFKLGRKTKEKT